ncbi:hypothetical protein ACFYVL_43870 [Streptomyces sp. NPDC004111]|uniref:hypothetical protein n=1 Tax=Streptomyces sp. NPDC004111 TaxID=3364690 RepID=UPI00368E2F37
MTTQPTQTDLITMTGPVAYAKAVEHAQRAAEYADEGKPATAQAFAEVAQAFAAIAAAEAAARSSAPAQGFYPEGGWRQHTHPEPMKPWWDQN